MRALVVIFLAIISLTVLGQEMPKVYDPGADAEKEVALAVKAASKADKHVLLIVGGNWCPWCVRLNGFLFEDPQIDSLIIADYEVVKVNYSKENKNLDLLKELGVPQRFGFPVLLILDGKGNRLHTQNSLYLEKDKSYDRERVIEFLQGWSFNAVRPENNRDYQ